MLRALTTVGHQKLGDFKDTKKLISSEDRTLDFKAQLIFHADQNIDWYIEKQIYYKNRAL